MHWATIITSTGALLGGLAIVIALIQLGNQREDRLRAQISKVGVWTQIDELPEHEFQITLFIRNASELPVEVHAAELAIDAVGYEDTETLVTLRGLNLPLFDLGKTRPTKRAVLPKNHPARGQMAR